MRRRNGAEGIARSGVAADVASRVVSLSQVCRKSGPLFPEAVYQPIGRAFGNENSIFHHAPQLPLKRAPVDLRAERLELLDVDVPVFKNVHQGLCLAGGRDRVGGRARRVGSPSPPVA